MDNINTLILLVAGIIPCLVFFGLILKGIIVSLDMLSKPTYLGLMYAEDVFRIEFLKVNKRPKNVYLKLIQNCFASIITLVSMIFLFNLLRLIERKEGLIQSLMSGELLPINVAILMIFSSIVILVINYFSEKDSDDGLTKIDKLDIQPIQKLIE